MAFFALLLIGQHLTVAQAQPVPPLLGLLTILIAPTPADKVFVVRDAKGEVIDRVANTSPVALQYEMQPGEYLVGRAQRVVKAGEQTGVMVGFPSSNGLNALNSGAIFKAPQKKIRPANNVLSFSFEPVGRPGTDDPGPMVK
jgi:hypothetical protein